MDSTISMKILSMLFMVFLGVQESMQLSCGVCDPKKCRDPRELNCKGGYVMGVCGCCLSCAKVRGEYCGGMWNMAGTCDKGLQCIPGNGPFEPGTCKRKESKWQDLPKCKRSPFEQPWQNSPFQPCRKIESLFCTRDCEKCCVFELNCNPDIQTYVSGERCRLQQKMLRYLRQSDARDLRASKRETEDTLSESALENILSNLDI